MEVESRWGRGRDGVVVFIKRDANREWRMMLINGAEGSRAGENMNIKGIIGEH